LENQRCCAHYVLAAQKDFFNQKPILQEVIEGLGHKVIFYSKFHCELNYIEIYWEAAKCYAQQHCDYTWKGLQETVSHALDSVPLNHIRKYSQKSANFMECYQKGLTGVQADYVLKKYKSHRSVSDFNIDELIK
jgi:hypothetical protein